ncbi:hypothetical protein Tco_0499224 [Tanacetum coccineum]
MCAPMPSIIHFKDLRHPLTSKPRESPTSIILVISLIREIPLMSFFLYLAKDVEHLLGIIEDINAPCANFLNSGPSKVSLLNSDVNIFRYGLNEKAMASKDEEDMIKKAVALYLVPAIRSSRKQPHMYRTSSDRQRVLSSDEENMKLKHDEGKLQQWFVKV